MAQSLFLKEQYQTLQPMSPSQKEYRQSEFSHSRVITSVDGAVNSHFIIKKTTTKKAENIDPNVVDQPKL